MSSSITSKVLLYGRNCTKRIIIINSRRNQTTTTTTQQKRVLSSLINQQQKKQDSSRQQQHHDTSSSSSSSAAAMLATGAGVVAAASGTLYSLSNICNNNNGIESKISACDTQTVMTPAPPPLLSSFSAAVQQQQHQKRPTTKTTVTTTISSPTTSTTTSSATNTTSAEPRRRMTHLKEPKNVMLHRMRSSAGRGMNDKYTVDWKTVIGEGAYGSVHPARLRVTGEKVALKKISKRFTNASSFKREAEALLRIYDSGGHPNISGLRDMYEDRTHFYMILDLISGGEMFDHLSNDGAYSEADAARLIFEIASALAFLHGVGLIHADLKPENILLCSKNRMDGTIKLIDFGCAHLVPELIAEEVAAGRGDPNLENVFGPDYDNPADGGTTGYWPPERFKKGRLTTAVDTWAVGVILYIMLSGTHPFDVACDRSDEEVAKAIQENPIPPMDDLYVGHLSQSAIDVIKRLMEPDPAKRMTAYELLHHPWVRGETAANVKIEGSDKKLSQYQDFRHKLEASFFAALVKKGHQNLTMSEFKRKNQENRASGVPFMKVVYDMLDEDGKGYVSGEDLNRFVAEQTGQVLDSEHTRKFLEEGKDDNSDESSPAEELSLSHFSKLFSGLKHKHYPRGHILFRAGDVGRSMYFLSSGKVEVMTRKNQLVSILRSGDFFGEGSLLDNEKRRFTSAKTLTPVDVIEITREDFDRYTRSSAETRNELKRKWRARSLVYAKNLLRLQTNVKARELKKGDTVYREGDVGTSTFRVDDESGGELEVLHGDTVVHKHVAGDSFGESSLLFEKPRSSTVRCATDTCRIHEMKGEDFIALVNSTPGTDTALRNMCRKRLFKKAVKQFSFHKNRGFSDEDLVAAFHEADLDNSGGLNLDELRGLMHRMDPNYPLSEIRLLMKYVDVDDDGRISLDEFKKLFRQFEDVKEE